MRRKPQLPPSRSGTRSRTLHDWEGALQRLTSQPNTWVQLLDEPVWQSTAPWCRDVGPLALRPIHEEVDFRIRNVQNRKGILYGMWTPDKEVVRLRLRSPLSPDDVFKIRVMYADGATLAELGKTYRLGVSAVWHIVTGRTWQDADGPLTFRKSRRTEDN